MVSTDDLYPYTKPVFKWWCQEEGHGGGQLSHPCDVAFTIDNSPVVAETGNKRLQFFTSTGETKTVVIEGSAAPLCLTTTNEGHVAATFTDGSIRTYEASGNCITNWSNEFSLPSPCGIAVNRRGQFIISDLKNCEVGLFEPDGNLIKVFETKINERSALRCPHYLATGPCGRIVISDRDNNCLKVFDRDGRYIQKFGCCSTGEYGMWEPHGLFIDPHSKILLADACNKRVSMHSMEGQFIQFLLTDEDCLVRPRGVALSPQGQLAVVDSSHSLMVYQAYHH